MDSVSRRIQYDHIWLLLDFIQHLKYIACYEFTVGNSVSCSIFFCRLNRLVDNLHTHDFFCHRGQHLTDRAGTAEKVEDGHVMDIANVLPHSLIQHFRSPCIWLEK